MTDSRDSSSRDKDEGVSIPLDSHSGPAHRISSSQAHDIVAAVLSAAKPGPDDAQREDQGLGEGEGEGQSAPIPAPARPWSALLVAALLLGIVVGGASAALFRWVSPPEDTEPAPSPPAVDEPNDQRASAHRRRGIVSPTDAGEPAPEETLEGPLPEPGGEAVPHPTNEEQMRQTRGPERRRVAPANTEQTAEAPQPVEMLANANRMRAARRWAEAERAYVRVLERFPDTTEAYVAAVASASLALEHLSRPRVALDRYRQALVMQPHGSLRAEAFLGICESHRALGDTAAETNALREFLRTFPESVHAPRMKERLRQVDPGEER